MNSIVIAKFDRHHNESGLQINGLNQNVSRSVCKATVHRRVVFLGCPRKTGREPIASGIITLIQDMNHALVRVLFRKNREDLGEILSMSKHSSPYPQISV
jgi:hypothetical protein